MELKQFYNGLSDKQIDKYRQEVCQRWGDNTLKQSEGFISRRSKGDFAKVQAEGSLIFETISDNMPKGFDSKEVQQQLIKWRKWLDNFSTYSDEAILELGRAYSKDPRFTKVFSDIHEDLPEFLTKAIEHYCSNKK